LVFSEGLMLELVRKGVPREDAYAWIQAAAKKVWDEKQDFKQAVLADSRITGKLSKQEIDSAFDLRHALRHTDALFSRLFKN
jgi:adenylosuccinate lyase